MDGRSPTGFHVVELITTKIHLSHILLVRHSLVTFVFYLSLCMIILAFIGIYVVGIVI
jgi:hypothetical protein